MKKVFLSLAMIAALTVVSCKNTETPAEEAPMTEEAAPMTEEMPATEAAADSTAVEAAEATEAAAGEATDAAKDAAKH